MEKVDYIKNGSCCNFLKATHPLFKVSVTLNPYAGCLLNCIYCPFTKENRIGVKTDYIHFLEKYLAKETNKTPIGLGSMSEPYNKLEKAHHLTRFSLEIIMKHKFPVQIFTKSELVLKDIDYLKTYSQEGLLAVSVSFSSADHRLSKMLEPEADSVETRLEILRELKRHNIFAGAVLAPIIPFVTDTKNSLKEMFDMLKGSSDYILPQVLNMDSSVVRKKMNEFVLDKFPKLSAEFISLYEEKTMPDNIYAQGISEILNKLSVKYKIPLFLPLEEGETSSFDINQELLR